MRAKLRRICGLKAKLSRTRNQSRDSKHFKKPSMTRGSGRYGQYPGLVSLEGKLNVYKHLILYTPTYIFQVGGAVGVINMEWSIFHYELSFLFGRFKINNYFEIGFPYPRMTSLITKTDDLKDIFLEL